MDRGSASHSKGELQEEVQCQWRLPTMKRDRFEPILEISHFLRVTCPRDVLEQHLPLIEKPEVNPIFQDYLKSHASLSPNSAFRFFEPMGAHELVVVPFIMLKEKPGVFEDFECLHIRKDFQLSYGHSFASVLAATIDLNMINERKNIPWEIGHHRGSSQQLMEEKHRSNKDLNLLTVAHHSMNGCVCTSDRDFVVPDWVNKNNVIYKQRNPVEDTVLHLAARYGNTPMVERMVQETPELCTTTNSNGDTPLHVAARAGHAPIIQCLLKVYLFSVRNETASKHPQALRTVFEKMLMVGLALFRNNQGNTFFHEAFMVNSHNGAMIFRAFEAPFITEDSEFEDEYKEIVNFLAPFATNKEGKSLLYLATDRGCKEVVNQLLDICNKFELVPQGISPLLPAIIKKDKDMLEIILSMKPTWIHLKDKADGRLPLHHAAFMGFHEGVSLLLDRCVSCAMESDKDGFLPIHLASGRGHVEAIKKLLKWCPDPIDFVDKNGRNFLHTAAERGKYEVVRYILQDPKLEKIINQKDNNGDTSLHLATRHWHPRIVYAFMWDERVNRDLLNQEYQTALDIAVQTQNQNPTLLQRLTWIALKSFGTKRSFVSSKDTLSSTEKEAPNVSTQNTSKDTQSLSEKKALDDSTQYKDRINTLIVVSTLIITVSFSVGFTVPGDVDEGKAVLLNHWAFHWFIFAITISMYGSISTTIILFLAQLEDLSLALFALKCARPLLGISLASLSIAFLAGTYLIVSKLSWLATTFLFLAGSMVLVVVLLYILLWLPSPSTSPFLRHISYFPLCVLAWVAEPEDVCDDILFLCHLIERAKKVEDCFEIQIELASSKKEEEEDNDDEEIASSKKEEEDDDDKDDNDEEIVLTDIKMP